MKALRLRLAVSFIVLIVVLAYALPNIPFIGNSALGTFMQDRISLGLDLKGGMNLTLGVDVEKAIQNTLTVTGQDISDRAKQEKITVMKPRLNSGGLLEVTLPRADQASSFDAMIGKWFPSLHQVSSDETASGRVYVFELSAEARKQTEDMTMEQVVRTIRNRIDQFGVAEPDIRKQSDNQVQVQLPGMTDAERAIQIIGQTAHLEFHIVRDDVDPSAIMLPPGTARYPLIVKGQYGTQSESTILLDTQALMGGEDITNARPAFNEFGQAYVALEFNNRGANNFERITGENIKKRMAIVLDGKVYSAPVIQDRIAGGKASITGNFTTEEAQDLAIVLRAGSLPTPVSVLEERTVGPSLGKESINSGIKASLVGAAAVVLVMPLYYGLSGIPVFQVSRFASAALAEGRKVQAVLDLLPGLQPEELSALFEARRQTFAGNTAEEFLHGIFHRKLAPVLLTQSRIRWKDKVADIAVPLTEVVPDTMESSLVRGLYLTGELLDADGLCGGYNLQWAWATGYLAGRAAGQRRRRDV